MPERFLRKAEIGAVFGTSPDVARAILRSHGVHPVDLGAGRGRGLRWLESAVLAVMQEMHTEANTPAQKAREGRPGRPHTNFPALAHMSVGQISELLTKSQGVQ